MHVHDSMTARVCLAVLSEKLRERAIVDDPAEIVDGVGLLMKEIKSDIENVIAHLGAFTSAVVGLDDFSLRDLLLAGDTILVDFLTPDGPGRLAVELDEDEPVSLVAAPEVVVQRWRQLH